MDTLFHSALSENSRLKTMPICHSSKQTPAAKINSKGGMGISNSISEFLTQSNSISQIEENWLALKCLNHHYIFTYRQIHFVSIIITGMQIRNLDLCLSYVKSNFKTYTKVEYRWRNCSQFSQFPYAEFNFLLVVKIFILEWSYQMVQAIKKCFIHIEIIV